MKKVITPIIIIVSCVLIDQLSKVWVVNNLIQNDPNRDQEAFFNLFYITNDGGAMGTNFGPPAYYLISSILILLFVLYYIYANRANKPIAFSLAFIAGGAIGNITDRIVYGEVIDFLDFDFFDINIFGYELYRWWTFNMADAFISCAIVYLLVYILFIKKETAAIESEDASDTKNN